MLALSFQVADQRFALSCRDVIEVVPLLRLRALPHAPAFVAGIFDYRGVSTPVIDLCMLVAARPCAERLSSRTILLRWQARTLGLLAERVTEAFDIDEASIGKAGVVVPDAPYLDGVVLAGDGSGAITQLIAPERLITEEVRRVLEGGEAPV